MQKFTIVSNDYEITKKSVEKLKSTLIDKKYIQDDINPEIVFVIGGDGTFLKAVHLYQNILEKVKLIPFKFGGIGYYTNKNELKNIEKILEALEKNLLFENSYQLLEVINGSKTHYIINEIRILNERKPLYTKIYINDEYLETFHGTGLVISTSTGSTGYIKSAGGSVILPKNAGLFQIQELVPVSTNRFRTLNSPIILNDKYVVKLEFETNQDILICDTQEREMKSNFLSIKVSHKKVNILSHNNPDLISEINILREIFIIDKKEVK
ncbi:inorganic polyphosphate/ATP-NAD kinase [Spiroplasma gladiatoris]|uniref:Inorganic polyphosphate/ATP-NAD kinase n=1 Tax=Spiroplasma gladiatoris TaxID=2143 RepID=A0A4P7AH56_9MOLU|nr:NAD(+)/NADH kinase [Spiroplasma gladiatoris]QBQ07451.1 inorganic polyphosphate/ATP-NAD kinase [Spiroplasma gladiatoris]